MSRVIEWFRKLFLVPSVVAALVKDLRSLRERLAAIEEQLRRHTTVSADIGFRDPSYCVVAGRYRGRDYVRIFHMRPDHLDGLIRQLHEQEKFYRPGRFDTPGGYPGQAITVVLDRMIEDDRKNS